MKKTLPRKPSEVIRLAIKDLTKIERDRRYVVNMDTWHRPNGKCAVCFAGSVMAKTLGADRTEDASPDTFSKTVSAKLDSLDDFRTGSVRYGLFLFYGNPADYWERSSFSTLSDRLYGRIASYPENDIRVPNYNPRNPKRFKDAMRALAARLHKAGF